MAGTSSAHEDGALEDSVLAVLLNPIRDLTENWEINLSRYLQEYHDLIVDNSFNAHEILSAINFAKAAIVIQKSVDIYGKKVDYLWQILHNVLDVLRNQRSDTDSAKTGAPGKKGREAKDNVQISTDFCVLDNFCDCTADISIHARETLSKVKLLPIYNPQLDAFLSVKKIELYGEKGNAVGNKYDYRVNKYLSSTALLLSEPELRLSRGSDMPANDYNDLDSPLAELAPELVANESVVSEGICAFEAAPTGEEIMEIDVAQEPETDRPEKTCRTEPKESANNSQECWERVVSNDERGRELLPRLMVNVPDAAEYISSVLQRKKPADNSSAMERNKIPPSLLAFFAKDVLSKGKKKVCYLAFQEYFSAPEQKKVKEPVQDEFEEVMRDLASEFGEDFCGFEDTMFIENDEEDVNFDANEADELAPLECLLPAVDIPTPSYGQFVKEAVVVPAVTVEIDDNITQIVNEWHDSIRHILKDSQERGHFNIHKYCGLVLSRFPYTEEHPVLPFSAIVGYEPVENVSRYFLATLMLANAYNVEIIKTEEDPLAMDCMTAKLLTRVRNNELLKEMYE